MVTTKDIFDPPNMEELPITGLEEIESHLQQLVQDPETQLNAKLFDEVELQLTGKQTCPGGICA